MKKIDLGKIIWIIPVILTICCILYIVKINTKSEDVKKAEKYTPVTIELKDRKTNTYTYIVDGNTYELVTDKYGKDKVYASEEDSPRYNPQNPEDVYIPENKDNTKTVLIMIFLVYLSALIVYISRRKRI